MKYAYVTLVMLGDKYVPGAIALARSLISSGTEYDKVCLITSDVTMKRDLERVYDRVVCVPFLHHECGSMLTRRQADLYADWIDYSFTKWRCLELVEYSKCVYLDADQIVLRNIDHLFNLNTPAMCFNHNYCPHFKHIKYGHKIKDLPFIFSNYSVLGFTGTLVFKPCLLLFRKIKQLLNPNNAHLKNNRFNNGFEEVVFAQALMALGIEPTQLSLMYLWNAGDYYALKNTQPYVINYYGDKKPWLTDEGEHKFMDEYIWWWFYSR
jgi:lipopolysaccharide biosynthesis glycosyltransferase